MKKNLILSVVTVLFILSACKKNNDNNGSSGIQGTYKLKYLTGKTNATLTGTGGEKSVTTSDYTSTNNTGVIVFGSSNATSTGMSYSINTLAYNTTYQDNVFVDSSSYPFSFTLPSSSSSAAYRLVGTDSIYFPQGSVIAMSGTGTTQGGPGGGRYTINGKLLTIIQNGSKDSTFQDSGETYRQMESVLATIVLEKQ
ncbi:MAG: hypothetical protein M3Z26_12385 [Bacteroidota bacterium]|nr:hypothetical protein [Bacteroidota bacterium]